MAGMDASKCWNISEYQGWNTISVKDRIDSFNYSRFESDVLNLLKTTSRPMAFELRQVRFLSFRAIQLLNQLAVELQARNLRAALVAPSEKIKRQIDIYAKLENWEVFRTVEELKNNRPASTDRGADLQSPSL